MAVPGRVEAASILLRLDPPARFVRHSAGVAEVAAFLATRAARHGCDVDRRLIESAALLHDVDKLLPRSDPARGEPHGRGSGAWLARIGYPELAPVVNDHPVTRLLDESLDPATWELEPAIVAYADKRVVQRLVPMAVRFQRWERRYPGRWATEDGRRAEQRAAELERRVCAAADIRPEAVRRLRWVRAALSAAPRT